MRHEYLIYRPVQTKYTLGIAPGKHVIAKYKLADQINKLVFYIYRLVFHIYKLVSYIYKLADATYRHVFSLHILALSKYKQALKTCKDVVLKHMDAYYRTMHGFNLL